MLPRRCRRCVLTLYPFYKSHILITCNGREQIFKISLTPACLHQHHHIRHRCNALLASSYCSASSCAILYKSSILSFFLLYHWMLIQGQGRFKSWILSLVAGQCSCLQFSQFSQLCNSHHSHSSLPNLNQSQMNQTLDSCFAYQPPASEHKLKTTISQRKDLTNICLLAP